VDRLAALVERRGQLVQDQPHACALRLAERVEQVVQARSDHRLRAGFARGGHLAPETVGAKGLVRSLGVGLERDVAVAGCVLLADDRAGVVLRLLDRLVEQHGDFRVALVVHLDGPDRTRDRTVHPHVHALDQRERVVELGDYLVRARRRTGGHDQDADYYDEQPCDDRGGGLGQLVGH
jgi:hypothetical protein